jgi:Leucine-rich repeat (LRR) protein
VVGNVWVVDGYKCKFQKEKDRPYDYICLIIPDSNKNAEKHISGKSDVDVVGVRFDAELHNVAHFTQSELTPFCQRFKNSDKITVHGNKLTSIDEDSFKGCKDIKKIEIKSTKIQEFPENLFAMNKKLSELIFSTLEIKTLPEKIFASQTELTSLSLKSIPFAYLPTNIFNPLTKLERLHLTEVNLKVNPKWFKTLTKLIKLGLSMNRITDLPKDVFSSLESLEHLDLSENQIKVIDSDMFGSNNKLQSIDFSNNQVYAFDEKIIKKNPRLNFLSIDSNSCVKEGRGELKARLARCISNYQPRQEQDGEL